MKAVQILGEQSSPQIVLNRALTQPNPKDAEILVAVHGAGITGDEVLWPEPYETATRIPGHDISGVISALGLGYTGSLKVGDEVYALLGAGRGQGQAEYAICSADELALKPKSLSHREAAALPIPILTAWEAIEDRGTDLSGSKVLVTGASGAVGLIFVQLATHLTNAKVTALASPQNFEALRSLGAASVLDYNSPDGWENLIEKVDVVFDAVGGDILKKAWRVVKPNGTIITVADPAPSWAFDGQPAIESKDHPDVKYHYFVVSPNGDRLQKASELLDNGSVKPIAVKAFPFDAALSAWSYARERRRGNKAVIEFRDEHEN